MMKTVHRNVWFLLMAVLAGCSQADTGRAIAWGAVSDVCQAEEEAPEHSKSPPSASDLVRTRKFQTEAAKCVDSGKFTPAADLVKQLSRKQCSLTLPAPTKQKLSPTEVYARRKESVLLVGKLYKCKRCTKWHVSSASGFLISEAGHFVTNYHVVKNSEGDTKMMAVMTYDGQTLPVKEVLAANEADDVAICLLEAGGKTLRPAPLSADAAIGTPVSVISHPRHRFYSLTHGIVSRYAKFPRGRNMATRMTITADFAQGSSGGPVFDDRGAVVGLVSSTSTVHAGST